MIQRFQAPPGYRMDPATGQWALDQAGPGIVSSFLQLASSNMGANPQSIVDFIRQSAGNPRQMQMILQHFSGIPGANQAIGQLLRSPGGLGQEGQTPSQWVYNPQTGAYDQMPVQQARTAWQPRPAYQAPQPQMNVQSPYAGGMGLPRTPNAFVTPQVRNNPAPRSDGPGSSMGGGSAMGGGNPRTPGTGLGGVDQLLGPQQKRQKAAFGSSTGGGSFQQMKEFV